MFFVTYTGDILLDPLNKGCEYFSNFEDAIDFRNRMKNKGYRCYIYQGIQLMN